jgi:hypothetical protein
MEQPQADVEAVAAPNTRTSRTHLTALPKGFITVRIMQLIGSVVILAFSVYAMVYIATVTALVGLITVSNFTNI